MIPRRIPARLPLSDDKPQNQNKFGSNFSVKPQQGVKPVAQGNGTPVRPYTPITPGQGTGTKPVTQLPNLGIKKPGNLRSSVEEKSLKIPDFLQKK